METFTLDVDTHGLPKEADMVSFIVGRHETDEPPWNSIEPFYHGKSAALSRLVFETTVGE